MNDIPRLSEAVYVGLCHEVGSPTEVRIRREVQDTEEFMNKPLYALSGSWEMKSVRKREGFPVNVFEDNSMCWYSRHKVICDLSQINLYPDPKHTVILMDTNNVTPGYTRLFPMRPKFYQLSDHLIMFSCEEIDNNHYISSILFRNNILRLRQSDSVIYISSIPPGPWSSFLKEKNEEAHNKYCLRAHHWPVSLLPWIRRCRKHSWPSENVISDIISAGFHVVPKGSTPENGEEWRISFSQAEQKLVYSLDHCQFLCYCLFRIFLKEVVNFQSNAPVLCSYFTKTVVFWVIQTKNLLVWTPGTLLFCFWECFRVLIHWVHAGECPHFFIPQNNMFRLKVVGSMQTSLFNHLNNLFKKGIQCLLLSQTLNPYLSKAILNRTLRLCTDESCITSRTELDLTLFRELPLIALVFQNKEFAVSIIQIEKVISRRLTPYQEVTLQYLTSILLRNTAISLQSSIFPQKRNKISYKVKKASRLLKLACKIGPASENLFLSMFLYRTCMFEHSLTCLQRVHEKLSLPYIMYNGHLNIDMYRQCMEGMSAGSKLREALVEDIHCDNNYSYIYEITFEQKISMKNGILSICIPPLVMLHMLLILNHHRLGNTVRSQQSLQDLQTLLLYDEGVNIPSRNTDISWQILGICQQICGDYLGSLQSYKYSLQQTPFHNIQEATLSRINSLTHRAM